EAASHGAREAAAAALQHQLVVELEQAKAGLEAVPSAPAMPPAPDPAPVHAARRTAEHARRDLASGTSALASLRTRREFLEEQLERMAPFAAAADRIPEAQEAVTAASAAASRAQRAALDLARLAAELDGLEAIHVEAAGLPRLADV